LKISFVCSIDATLSKNGRSKKKNHEARLVVLFYFKNLIIQAYNFVEFYSISDK